LTATDWSAFVLTIKLAVLTTGLLLLLGTPLAWWLARTRSHMRPWIEALVALPLVLPPTVLGFYLLIALGPEGPIGSAISWFGGPSLAFTFTGLVLGSMVYSLPFVVQPLQSAFSTIPSGVLDAAATLGAAPADCFRSVALPLAKTGFLVATVLGFAHTLGEFGVVLMIGGNIPGETQVLSIAIYEHVEGLEYSQAHGLSLSLLLFSMVLLVPLYARQRRRGHG
jgi:molybdate transport system permease protein